MIGVDTNLIVYAHRGDAEWHEPAAAVIRDLAEGSAPWAIPWPCLHEFYAIATHPRIYNPPSTRSQAIDQIDAWLTSPSVVLLTEGVDHWQRLVEVVNTAKVTGPMVHDARIAAICVENGVSEFLTFDRDFSRFPMLHTRNPLMK